MGVRRGCRLTRPRGRIVVAFTCTGGGLAIASVAPLWLAAIALACAGAAMAQAECAATGVIQDVAVGRATGVLGLTDTVMVGSALAGACLAPLLLVAGPTAVLFGAGAACAGAALRSRGPVTAFGTRVPTPLPVMPAPGDRELVGVGPVGPARAGSEQ